MSQYSIHTMSRPELDIAVDWAAAEGWNPGLHDADSFFATDHEGFLIGKLDDEPIAVISAVKYGSGFGFLGFYIVKPEYRGQGYGIQIWNAAMEAMRGRNIGLDGVVAQQENYKKSGFTLAYRNIRYEGHNKGEGRAVDHSANGIASVPIAQVPFDTVLAYDQPFFPDNHRRFLEVWIKPPAGTALACLHDGELAGYGVIRQCREGYKIGPLFADDVSIAETLFLALVATTETGAKVFLDTPEVNAEAVALAQRHQMSMSFETARMYTHDAPKLPINRLFGVTTFELG